MSEGIDSDISTHIDKEELLENIENARGTILSSSSSNTLKDSFYSALDAASRIALAYKDSNGVKGWSATIENDKGEPLFSEREQESLESTFTAPSASTYPSKQQGGSISLADKLADLQRQPSSVSAADISFDKVYEDIQSYLQTWNDTANGIAKTIGPVAFTERVHHVPVGPYPPYLPIKIDVPTRPILPIINTFLETIRLLVTYGPIEIPILRVASSFITALYELSLGKWKESLLTSLGIWQRDAVLMGTFGKIFLLVWSFVDPTEQQNLSDTIFRASKSVLLGFWLTVLDLVAPEEVRSQIHKFLEKVEIFKNPAAICKPEIQELIKQFSAIPPMRLGLELLNIPTTSTRLQKLCGQQKGEPSIPQIPTAIPSLPAVPSIKSIPSTRPIKGGASRCTCPFCGS